jgi:hypothetical protein
MPSRKIPVEVTGGVCLVEEAFSFGDFSLGQQRKVTRRQAEALDLLAGRQIKSKASA